jgi:hypothetical protein
VQQPPNAIIDREAGRCDPAGLKKVDRLGAEAERWRSHDV